MNSENNKTGVPTLGRLVSEKPVTTTEDIDRADNKSVESHIKILESKLESNSEQNSLLNKKIGLVNQLQFRTNEIATESVSNSVNINIKTVDNIPIADSGNVKIGCGVFALLKEYASYIGESNKITDYQNVFLQNKDNKNEQSVTADKCVSTWFDYTLQYDLTLILNIFIRKKETLFAITDGIVYANKKNSSDIIKMNSFDNIVAEYDYILNNIKDATYIYLHNLVINSSELATVFENCRNLQRAFITFYTPPTNLECAFSGMRELEELDIGNFDMAKVTNMKGAFDYCTNLKKLILGFNISTSLELQYCPLNLYSASRIIGSLANLCGKKKQSVSFNVDTYDMLGKDLIKIAEDKNWIIYFSFPIDGKDLSGGDADVSKGTSTGGDADASKGTSTGGGINISSDSSSMNISFGGVDDGTHEAD